MGAATESSAAQSFSRGRGDRPLGGDDGVDVPGDVAGTRAHLLAGIAGSEELQLPVLRAQLRWMEAVLAMWTGDFAEAKRHHATAAHVHEQTELYEAGSGLLAAASLLRETGEALDPSWAELRADTKTGGQGMVGVVRAALLTMTPTPGVRAEATAMLREWSVTADRGHIWTTLGHQTLLAHLAADHGLDEFAEPLLEQLTPHRERIAVIGQVGLAGPVALATARLHVALGDTGRARADLATARALAERAGERPRCCGAGCSSAN